MFEEMHIGIAIRDYLANQGDERRERDYLKFYEEYLKRYRTFDEVREAFEKAEEYDELKRKANILDENLDVIRDLGVLMEKAEKYDKSLQEPDLLGKWDKLWTDAGYEFMDGDRMVSKDWLYEVKAEGDKFRRALVQLEIPERMKMHKQLEDIKAWVIEAKAQGRISMSSGFTLDRILGVEESG
jgi:hypothetical protein